MSKNKAVVDTKPNNSLVVDSKPDNALVVDTRPNNESVGRETEQFYDVVLSAGGYMGIPLLTYPEEITVSSSKTN